MAVRRSGDDVDTFEAVRLGKMSPRQAAEVRARQLPREVSKPTWMPTIIFAGFLVLFAVFAPRFLDRS